MFTAKDNKKRYMGDGDSANIALYMGICLGLIVGGTILIVRLPIIAAQSGWNSVKSWIGQ